MVKGGYAVLYLPDLNNRELIAQGEAFNFYYIPNLSTSTTSPILSGWPARTAPIPGTIFSTSSGSPGQAAKESLEAAEILPVVW